MTHMKQILLVARFESKMLLRSWPFRIIAFICSGLAILQILAVLALLYFASGDTNIGPFFTSSNNNMLGLQQIGGLLMFMVIFFANDIGARDKRVAIADVVGSRPLTVAQYVIGRLLGLMLPLTVLMALVFGAIMLIHNAFDLQTASPREYVPFFFYSNVLTVAYVVALTAFISTILKNRLFTSLAGIAVILSITFFLAISWDLFDFSGFRAAEVYSDLIGRGPIAHLAAHRMMYLLLTAFLVSATIFMYPRPQDARRSLSTKAGLAILSVAASANIAYLVFAEVRTEADKREWKEAMVDASTNQSAAVSHYDMDINLLAGKSEIEGNVTLSLVNRGETPQDTFVFMLNPGLSIGTLTVAEDPSASFERTGPVVHLKLGSPLTPGGSVDTSWEYGGHIDPKAAWLIEPPAPEGFQEGNLRQLEFMMGSLSGWVGRKYCFLLPESQWYPIPNSTFGHTYPDKRPANFATARIRLNMPEQWTAVTQGTLRSDEKSGENKVQLFETDSPVPMFSLYAGEYAKRSTTVRGIDFDFLYAPVHGENVDFFADAAEEIERVISESLENIEDKLGLEYPYKSLSLVEVPASCRSFSDTWDGRTLFAQPGVMLIAESNFFKTYFTQSYERSKNRTKNQGTGATDAQIKAEILRRYFTHNSFGGDLELNLIPNYWEFQVDATGEAFPALGSAFSAALAETALGRHQKHSVAALYQMTQPSGEILVGESDT
ncbi:MAG: hypothetical protein VCB26_11230, partial [Candidatus Hydrogenedentota bacterium]